MATEFFWEEQNGRGNFEEEQFGRARKRKQGRRRKLRKKGRGGR
jgi:hypothetical protein